MSELNMNQKPSWLKVNYNAKETQEVVELMKELQLNTVCNEANCPNLGECYKKRTATFMILGSQCTRNCKFCNVITAKPEAVDPEEPKHLAEAAKALKLKHVVVTSVDRDDLPDGGAEQFAKVIRELRKALPEATIEVLIPDFKGDSESLLTVLREKPDVLNHNVETVPRIFKEVCPQSKYEISLKVLREAREFAEAEAEKNPTEPRMLVKTGVILGLGENDEDLKGVYQDLVENGVDILTLGQYLRPSTAHMPVDRYVKPEEFERYKKEAEEAGIAYVASSPLVRSSYRAEEALTMVRQQAEAAQ